MGESVSAWSPSCNGSIRIDLDGQRITSDIGALPLREALECSGVIDSLDDHLVDTHDALRISYSLANQLRAVVFSARDGLARPE